MGVEAEDSAAEMKAPQLGSKATDVAYREAEKIGNLGGGH
jgi:hypothetical protein